MNKIFKNIILLSAFCFLVIPNISYAEGVCICNFSKKDDNKIEFLSKQEVGSEQDVTNEVECEKYNKKSAKYITDSCVWISGSKALVADLDLDDLNQLSVSTPQALIGLVIKSVMGILGTITLVMIIYGGLIWMTSSGNSEKTKKARDIIIWASLGIVVIFASYAILNTILNIFAK